MNGPRRRGRAGGAATSEYITRSQVCAAMKDLKTFHGGRGGALVEDRGSLLWGVELVVSKVGCRGHY